MTRKRPLSIRDYRDLHVWQRAIELAAVSYRLARILPPETQDEVGSQIRRAANAVAANIAEGHSRPSRADYRRFVGMARASAREVETHLHVAVAAGYFDADGVAEALKLIDRISRMLMRLHQRLGERPGSG